MTEAQVLEKVRDLVAEKLSVDPAKIVPELASAMRVFIEYNTPSEQGSSAEISSPVPVSEEECFPGVR